MNWAESRKDISATTLQALCRNAEPVADAALEAPSHLFVEGRIR